MYGVPLNITFCGKSLVLPETKGVCSWCGSHITVLIGGYSPVGICILLKRFECGSTLYT